MGWQLLGSTVRPSLISVVNSIVPLGPRVRSDLTTGSFTSWLSWWSDAMKEWFSRANGALDGLGGSSSVFVCGSTTSSIRSS